MPRTSFEKVVEKQIRESKRQEQKQKQENRRLERQTKRESEKQIRIQQWIDNTVSIVHTSARIGDMAIMIETYEIMLNILNIQVILINLLMKILVFFLRTFNQILN